MKLTAITTTVALLAFPAFAGQSIVYPQCELVDMGGYYNLAPAGCSRVSRQNEKDNAPVFDFSPFARATGLSGDIKDLPDRFEDWRQ